MSEAGGFIPRQQQPATIPSAAAAKGAGPPPHAAEIMRRQPADELDRRRARDVDDDDEKELRSSLIRSVLPDCQPQEGSPANTFTDHELQELQAALLPQMNIIRPLNNNNNNASADAGERQDKINNNNANINQPSINNNMMNIMGPWEAPKEVVRAVLDNNSNNVNHSEPPAASSACATGTSPLPASGAVVSATDTTCYDADDDGDDLLADSDDNVPVVSHNIIATTNDCSGPPQEPPQEEEEAEDEASPSSLLNWHGAPRFPKNVHIPRQFRELVRSGRFTGPTNAVCSGFLQCNLVVLPKSYAFDFLLFCQRNPRACPLIEVCDTGSSHPIGVAPGADLRTDVPKYAIYRNGELEREVTDVTEYWPHDSVAFLIGCSFSYDGALMDAGIPLRSAEEGKNVPMYRTSLPCRSAGSLHGNMVVSMKPIPAMKLAKHVEITSKYAHAHGGPVCVGRSQCIGIADSAINEPDWGDKIDIRSDEIPVFHACGVTPQAVLMDSKIPFAITHAAGHMFVTDLPADMGV